MARKRFTAVFYLKPRAASVVAYLPALNGVRPVTAKVARSDAEAALASARARKKWSAGGRTEAVSASLSNEGLALLLLKIPGVCKVTDFKALDELVKEAYRRSGRVKELVGAKALEKVNGDEDLARAYVRAWLKASSFELPEDDPDAELVSRQYYKLVWKMGSKYVVQDPPWC